MLFTDPIFLFAFFPLCLIIQALVKSIAIRNVILLILSLVFYAWGEPVYVFLMVAVSLISWIFTKLMVHNNRNKLLLVLTVVVSLLPLMFFKYGQMILDIVNIIPYVNISMPVVALPIGISFYTFQILTYVIDVYRDEADVQKNPLNFMLYISLFPQLIAGPIVRYSDVEKQLQNRTTTPEMFSEGVYRFLIGLGKKVLLANVVGAMVQNIFTHPLQDLGTLGAWGAMLCYTFQIYFDFSGYSDMAIGLGKILGFTYHENFNYPYISCSIKEFWRRWHISMNTFFRDYVYIPLGGNRKRKYLNMFVVWALTGLWHGAGYNFIVWGLYFFVLLSLENILYKKFTLPKFVSMPLTFVLVLIGWVFFYFEDFTECLIILRAMFGLGGNFSDPISANFLYTAIPVLVVCAFCATPVYSIVREKVASRISENARICCMAVFTVVMLFACTACVISSSYNPFLYFKF